MKKKTRQKWMLLMLTAALCGMLAGCGSDGSENNRNRDLETEEEDGGTEDREDKEENIETEGREDEEEDIETEGREDEEEDIEIEDREDEEEVNEDSDRPNVTFKNATSWGYSGSNIWLFKDGAVIVCVDTGEIPEGEMQEEIPKGAVRSVYVEEDVASINEDMFRECANLVSVYVAGDTKLGSNAFRDCSSLTSVAIPNETEEGNYSDAFLNCGTDTSIEGRYIGIRAEKAADSAVEAP